MVLTSDTARKAPVVSRPLYNPSSYWLFGVLLGLPPLLFMSNENALRMRSMEGRIMGRVVAFFALYLGLVSFAFYRCWRLIRTAVRSAANAGYDVNRLDPGMVNQPVSRGLDFPVFHFLPRPVLAYVLGNIILAMLFILLTIREEKAYYDKMTAEGKVPTRRGLYVFVWGLIWHVVLFGGLLLFVYVIRDYNIANQNHFYRWPL